MHPKSVSCDNTQDLSCRIISGYSFWPKSKPLKQQKWKVEAWHIMKEREVAQSCPTLCDPMDCSLPGSSVHGIFQARVLEWVAISFSRGSSGPRYQTRSPALQADSLLSEPPGKPYNERRKSNSYWVSDLPTTSQTKPSKSKCGPCISSVSIPESLLEIHSLRPHPDLT